MCRRDVHCQENRRENILRDSGDENTRAHYRHLLYKIDKVLESDIAARDSR